MPHTLNIFPQLLDLPPFFGPAILRVTLALVFLYLARFHFHNRCAVASEIPLTPKSAGIFLAYTLSIVESVFSLMLLVGIYTQAVSMLAVAASVKALFWQSGRPYFSPFSTSTYILIIIISLSLIIMGAGAFAVDLAL